MARALPLYFADPYAVEFLKHEDDAAEWAEASITVSGPLFTRCGSTSTFGNGTTTATYRYDGLG